MEADDIAHTENIVHGHEYRAGFVCGRDITGHDVHAECPRDRRHIPSDPSIPDNAHREALQLDKRHVPEAEVPAVGPSSRAHRRRMMPDLLGHFEQEGEHRLHNRFRGVFGNIRDRNASLGGGSEIDHVVTGCHDTDVAHGGQGFDGDTVEDGLVGEDNFSAVGAGHRFFRWCTVVDG